MQLFYNNFFDTMTLTPSSETDDFLVGNLKQQHLYRKWRTTNDTSENVVAEVTSGYQEFGLSSKAVGTETGLSRISPEVLFEAAATSWCAIAWLNSTHFVVAYRDEGNSNYGTAVIGVLAADGTISFGTPDVFESSATTDISVVGLDATHFVVCYSTGANGIARIGETDGSDTVDNWGAVNNWAASTSANISVAKLDSTHFVVAFANSGSADEGTARVGLTDGDVTISSYGAANEFNAAATDFTTVAALDATHFVVAYQDTANSSKGTAIIGLVSVTTISSYGAENVFNDASTGDCAIATLDSTRFVIAFVDTANSSQGTAIVGLSNGGTTISSYGAENIFNAVVTADVSIAKTETNKFIVAYQDDGGSDYGATRIGSTLGTTISGYDTEYEFNVAVTSNIAIIALDSIHYAVAYRDEGNSDQGTARIVAPKFYINVDVDGAGISEDSIQLTAGSLFSDLITALEAAVAGTTWSITGGDLRCTSDAFGASSTISITAGSSGLDLAAYLTGFTSYDTAVAGVGSGAVTAAFLAGYNISSAAVVKIQGHTANSWGGPDVSITMTRGANGIYYALAGFSTKKWWRFLITDPTNSDGFIQIGRAWLGDTVTIITGPARATTENRSDASVLTIGRSGESFGDKRYRFRHYDILFPKWDNTNKTGIETFLDAVMSVDPFFVAFDSDNIDRMPLMYGVVGNEVSYANLIAMLKWGGSLNFREVF